MRADLDDTSVALYFALRPPAPGATLFRDIRELVPGSSMRVGHTHESSSVFWRPPAERPAWRRPDREYIEEYRDVLRASVRAALRCAAPPAALMSGGLDSTTVVALACGGLKESGSATPIRTISWVFDEIRECDERRWIDVMVRAFGLPSVTFPGDRYWPLRDFSSWPTRAGGPERNPYRMLKGRAYSEAALHGHRVLLIGASGDQIYIRWRDALASMITQLRVGALAEELWLTWRQWGVRGMRHHRAVRRLGGMLAERIVPARSPARSRVPAWLSPAGAALVEAASSAEQASFFDAPALHPAVSWRTAWSTGRERPAAAGFGVELRDPFRDRRVVELALRLPPHLLLRRTLVKHLVREAMRGILPEEVRLRTANSSLLGLYRRGVLDRERSALERLVGNPNAAWRRFVDERLLRESCSDAFLGGKDQARLLLPFVCASYDQWSFRQGWGVRDERIEGVG
ncbi:MAG: asparagine synthase-related protein [Thermoanaerobaculaceae bacterium]